MEHKKPQWTLINNTSHAVLTFKTRQALRNHVKANHMSVRQSTWPADRCWYSSSLDYVPAEGK
jgi:hypothetical protein